MNDYDRIMQLVQELRQRLDQLEKEIGQLRTAPAAGERSLATGEGSPYDLSKVIPPTRTDEPDSIVGGQPTRAFPDCVAVGGDRKDARSGYFCSGTLIAPNLVVSAGHCWDVPKGQIPTRVFVKGYDISEPDDGETIRVKSRHRHKDHDLLLLVLEENSTVPPRHIAQGVEINAADRNNAVLVGFGTIDFAGTVGYGVKRSVEVPITSLDCASPDDATDYGCEQNVEMVAGHRGLNKDSCRGDSGGPLYIRSAEGDYYLLGATSRGAGGPRDCGDGGVYVRVDQFVEWIKQETGIVFEGIRL